jgi:hypothetical protein
MKEIDKIAFIEIQQGKIWVRNLKGKYYIPGGKRESGESDEQTLDNRGIKRHYNPKYSWIYWNLSAQSDGEKKE